MDSDPEAAAMLMMRHLQLSLESVLEVSDAAPEPEQVTGTRARGGTA
jgi:DNA-binding GntR family transcriptional regulator